MVNKKNKEYFIPVEIYEPESHSDRMLVNEDSHEMPKDRQVKEICLEDVGFCDRKKFDSKMSEEQVKEKEENVFEKKIGILWFSVALISVIVLIVWGITLKYSGYFTLTKENPANSQLKEEPTFDESFKEFSEFIGKDLSEAQAENVLPDFGELINKAQEEIDSNQENQQKENNKEESSDEIFEFIE